MGGALWAAGSRFSAGLSSKDSSSLGSPSLASMVSALPPPPPVPFSLPTAEYAGATLRLLTLSPQPHMP
jgi:hypothetical protein